MALSRRVDSVPETLLVCYIGFDELRRNPLFDKGRSSLDAEIPVDVRDDDGRPLLAESASRGPPDSVSRPVTNATLPSSFPI